MSESERKSIGGKGRELRVYTPLNINILPTIDAASYWMKTFFKIE